LTKYSGCRIDEGLRRFVAHPASQGRLGRKFGKILAGTGRQTIGIHVLLDPFLVHDEMVA
jgi:hypothetical protein